MSKLIDAKIEGKSRVFFIKGDRTAIVDTGVPGNERNILRALRTAGIPQDQVSVLVITHAHWDHCGSAASLKKALSIPLLAGWPDADYFEKGENTPIQGYAHDAGRAIAPKATWEGLKVDVVAKEDMRLDALGIDAAVLTTPGHTEGSLSVLTGNGDCATGDFLSSLYSEDAAMIRNSLKKLADGGAKRFFPSHGGDIVAKNLFDEFLSDSP